jgi:hypothetical protein
MSARPWFAVNGPALLETRRQGMCPTGPVVVSLIGGRYDVSALYVHDDMPLERMDWQMLVNLHVHVLASPAVPFDRIERVLWDIAHVRPRELLLQFVVGNDVHEIDCGTGMHLPAVEHIPAARHFHWLPITTTRGPAMQLKRALVACHPETYL